jgi:nitrogenase molybdenum-iron protein alpha chain
MSIYTGKPELEVRERRLRSIISYNGTGRDLYDKAKAHCGAGYERSFSQCSSCPQSSASVIMSRAQGAAVIYHAPIGCAEMIMGNAIGVRGSCASRKIRPFDTQELCSNIEERDTIFGAAGKLREAIREAARRFNPSFVFIATSCASGIIGEDIEGIIEEMEDEVDFPLVPVYCEGFKSKIWSSGFDSVYNGLLRKIVKKPEKKQGDLVNIFGFDGTDVFTPLLARAGLRANYIISLAEADKLETMSEAACSTSICETLSLYIAAALEEVYGVPEVKTPPPYGIDWTTRWFREIGRLTGRSPEVEQAIKEEWKAYKDEIEFYREKLKGKTLYITAGDAYGHNLASVARDLGVNFIGMNSLHHDLYTDNPESVHSMNAAVEDGFEIPNFTVCNMQPYQVMKFVKRLKPDFLIVRHPGLVPLGPKLGIPTLYEGGDSFHCCSWFGVARTGKRLYEALITGSFVRNIAAHIELPYTEWWLNEADAFAFTEENGGLV